MSLWPGAEPATLDLFGDVLHRPRPAADPYWPLFGDTAPYRGIRRRMSRWQHDLVEGYRLARHAQDLRAEAATGGYDSELEEYFDPLDGVEKRLTFRDYLIGLAETAEQEEEAWNTDDDGWDEQSWSAA